MPEPTQHTAPAAEPPLPASEASRLERQAREAAALRENLRKRRLQNQQRHAEALRTPEQAD